MKTNRGFGKGTVIAIIVLLVVGGGWYFANRLGDAERSDRVAALQETKSEVLAGNASTLRTFTQEAYEEALASGDVVFLWYYANWCPTCKLEQQEIKAAFNEFDKPGIVGFRVNIGDSDTEKAEEETAREFGVAYRHTKVAIKNDERILKSPETWDKERYLEEFATLLE